MENKSLTTPVQCLCTRLLLELAGGLVALQRHARQRRWQRQPAVAIHRGLTKASAPGGWRVRCRIRLGQARQRLQGAVQRQLTVVVIMRREAQRPRRMAPPLPHPAWRGAAAPSRGGAETMSRCNHTGINKSMNEMRREARRHWRVAFLLPAWRGSAAPARGATQAISRFNQPEVIRCEEDREDQRLWRMAALPLCSAEEGAAAPAVVGTPFRDSTKSPADREHNRRAPGEQ